MTTESSHDTGWSSWRGLGDYTRCAGAPSPAPPRPRKVPGKAAARRLSADAIASRANTLRGRPFRARQKPPPGSPTGHNHDFSREAMKTSTIQWTQTDEAPELARYSCLRIVRAFVKGTGIQVETRDISLAGRIIANFPDNLTDAQKISDHLALLGELTQHAEAIIIKLPNISSSVPQIKEAVKELRAHGYNVPEYPDNPNSDADKKLQERFTRVLGSAVNPLLREGNSDRRSPLSVKAFSR